MHTNVLHFILYFLQVDLTANHSEIAKNGLRRLWGVPDTSAYVGHLFRMEIPKEAFSGEVLAYKVPIIVFVSSVCRGKSFAKFTSPQGSIAKIQKSSTRSCR